MLTFRFGSDWRVCLLQSLTFFILLYRGENLAGKDIGQVAKTLEKKLDDADEDAEDDDELDIDDAPIFTPELARLKAKE